MNYKLFVLFAFCKFFKDTLKKNSFTVVLQIVVTIITLLPLLYKLLSNEKTFAEGDGRRQPMPSSPISLEKYMKKKL